jgi:hypothetical protein
MRSVLALLHSGFPCLTAVSVRHVLSPDAVNVGVVQWVLFQICYLIYTWRNLAGGWPKTPLTQPPTSWWPNQRRRSKNRTQRFSMPSTDALLPAICMWLYPLGPSFGSNLEKGGQSAFSYFLFTLLAFPRSRRSNC